MIRTTTTILISVCLLMMAAACASTEDQTADLDPTSGPSEDPGGSGAVAEPLDDDAADQESEVSNEDDPSADSAVDRISAGFVEVESLVGRLTKADPGEVAQCMSDAGFPQLLELDADSRSAAGLSSANTNRLTSIQPHEMGPYTESQAREFGLLGSVHIGRTPDSIVRSNDPAYHRQYALCDEASLGDRGQFADAEVESLALAASDLRYAISSQFRTRTIPGQGELLRERLTCLTESGYGSVDPEALLSDQSWTDSLRRFGIQPGETRIISEAGEEFDPLDVDAPLPPGETRLIRSADMPTETYYPSAEEVELALVYVRCGEEIDFVERLEELQIPIRAEILAEFETEILGLRERVLELIEDG